MSVPTQIFMNIALGVMCVLLLRIWQSLGRLEKIWEVQLTVFNRFFQTGFDAQRSITLDGDPLPPRTRKEDA